MTVSKDLPKEARVFLDALAVGESGEGEHYNILFGGGHFSDYSRFPRWAGWRTAAGMTHAAGRYQFEPATWLSTAQHLGLKDFTPESQDKGAWWLAQNVYHHMTNRDLLADLEHSHLQGVAYALQSTWTSLSATKFPKRYAAALTVDV